MSAIKYISENCYNLKLILKIDDDIVFHPNLLLDRLLPILTNNSETKRVKSLETATNTITCYLHNDTPIIRLDEFNNGAFALHDSVLSGESVFPPFCAGFFVAMSGDVPRSLHRHLATNKPFWMEDRYMGVLQKRANISNLDIHSMLDYGYHNVTQANITSMTEEKVLVQHLPGKMKQHMSEVFSYLNADSIGNFTTLQYKTKRRINMKSMKKLKNMASQIRPLQKQLDALHSVIDVQTKS